MKYKDPVAGKDVAYAYRGHKYRFSGCENWFQGGAVGPFWRPGKEHIQRYRKDVHWPFETPQLTAIQQHFHLVKINAMETSLKQLAFKLRAFPVEDTSNLPAPDALPRRLQ
eukprot:1158632-Pelagomonas_calceolata.AAC.7